MTATNTCPAPPAVFDQLVFWTLGYGGWMGIALLPVVWALPISKTIRAVASCLLVPTSAFVLTAIFSAFYLFSQFLYKMASVMVSPQFLHSCVAIVCLAVGSVGVFLASAKRLEIQMTLKKEEVSEMDQTDDESVGSSACSQGSEESEEDNENEDSEATDSEESEEGSKGSDADSEGTEGSVEKSDEKDDSWREKANFEGLRTADPLPE